MRRMSHPLATGLKRGLVTALVLCGGQAASAQSPPLVPDPHLGSVGGATAVIGRDEVTRERQDTTPSQGQAPTGPATSNRKWEFEFHGAFSLANALPSSGSGTVPTTGVTTGGLISAASFYFGNAVQLFNQNAVSSTGPQSPQITTLDPALQTGALQWQHVGRTLGGRASRSLSERLALEFTVDYSMGELTFTNAARSGIEATRASFIPALERALAVSPVPSTVTSVATLNSQKTSQLFATGGFTFNLKTTGRVTPYATLGAGVVFNSGDTPTATLVGNYQLGSAAQVFGSDTVDLHYTVEGHALVGVGGGGLKFLLSPRWGIRVDGRAYVYRTTVVNLVAATPVRALLSSGSPFPIVNVGALQFSSTGPLTGGAIFDTAAYTATGLQGQVSLAVGLFLRF